MAFWKQQTRSGLLSEKVLGISLGNREVSLALMTLTLKDQKLSGTKHIPLPAHFSPEETAELVRQAIEENGLHADRIVLGLNGQKAFWRQISFPFAKRDKIAQALPFELEPLVPVALESLCSDFIPLGISSGESHPILAAGIDRSLVERWLNAFSGQDIEPEIIGLDTLGPWLLSGQFQDPMPEHYVLLDWQWTSLNLLFVSNRRLLDTKIIQFDLQNLGNPPGSGADSPPRSRSQLQESIREISGEIRMALFSLQAKMPDVSWEQIILSGTGASIKGIAPVLEQMLQIPVRRAHEALPTEFVAQARDAATTDRIVSASGLALTGIRGRQGINFRQGELAHGGENDLPRYLYPLAATILVLLLFWTGFLGIQSVLLSNRLQNVESRMEAVFNRALPDFQGNVLPSQYESVLKARVLSLKGGTDDQSGGAPAINILLEVSKKLGQGLDLTLESMIVDTETVSLTGSADSFNTVNQAKTRLMQLETISDVKIRGAKANTGGNTIQFSMQLIRTNQPGV